MLGLWSLAVFACVLGLIARPTEAQESLGQQLLDVVRIVSTTALSLVLVLGPGIVLRDLSGRRNVPLGFLPLPGIALLIAIGSCAWLLAGTFGSAKACFVCAAPLLALLFLGLMKASPKGMLEPGERSAMLIVGCLLGLAIARAFWFFGPEGELFAGMVSRTLEVGGRSDSRIPFHVAQLVAHGTHPYSALGTSYFAPYNFSSRGPLAGIASAPIVLLAGGRPPAEIPEAAWKPFDPSGFMAFRLAMTTLSCTALLSLWTLVRTVSTERAARFAVLLAATTPFLLHEAWFTWPKPLTASFVLLATVCLLGNRAAAAGVLVGVAYLMHPSALLAVPALSLLALWPLRGRDWRRPRIGYLLGLLLPVAAAVLFWKVVNGPHYIQDSFYSYLTEAGPGVHAAPWADPGTWIVHRLKSLELTVVPMTLALTQAGNPSINVFGGSSPFVIHFFFQYWNTLPFGVGIAFFPLLLVSLWRAWQRWRWPVLLAVVLPFVIFLVYWGSYTSGLLPEGLQTWVLMVLAVVAVQQAAAGFPWLRSRLARAILSLRALELLVVAVAPTWATHGELISAQYPLTDSLALIGCLAFCGGLAALVWLAEPGPAAESEEEKAAEARRREEEGNRGVGRAGRGFEGGYVYDQAE